MEHVNQYISKAMTAIEECIVKEGAGRKVEKEYKGYIASMGPSIIQTGLIPTLLFFTDGGKARRDTDRNNVLVAILAILKTWDGYNPNLFGEGEASGLFEYVRAFCSQGNVSSTANRNPVITIQDLDPDKLLDMEEEILTVIVALKLSLRTFNLDKP